MIIKPEEYNLIYCDYTKTAKRRVIKKDYEPYGFNSFVVHKTEKLDFRFHLFKYVSDVFTKLENLPEYPWYFISKVNSDECYFFTKEKFDNFVIDFEIPEEKLLVDFDRVEDLPSYKPSNIFLYGSLLNYDVCSKTKIIKHLCEKLELRISSDNCYSYTVVSYLCRKTRFSIKNFKETNKFPICRIYYPNDKIYYLIADDLIKYLNNIVDNML